MPREEKLHLWHTTLPKNVVCLTITVNLINGRHNVEGITASGTQAEIGHAIADPFRYGISKAGTPFRIFANAG
ncbi:MAG: hypothetical protein DRH12_17000 [Deltaproteobacteria bacterium]|nr:MAG: hypothetical protein DRH12_17000 [Deltaproteobacteria bacterium]RLB76505.1 MAG: hypothetical protein DRH15_12545 [Deltaproteobacteria bacterium]